MYPLISAVPCLAPFITDAQGIDNDWRELPLLDLPDEIKKIDEPDKFWYELSNLRNCGEEKVLPFLPTCTHSIGFATLKC